MFPGGKTSDWGGWCSGPSLDTLGGSHSGLQTWEMGRWQEAPKSICWVPKQPHSPYPLGSCPSWSEFGNVISLAFLFSEPPLSMSLPIVTCNREALLAHSLSVHYPPLPLLFSQLRKFHSVCPVPGLLALPSLTHRSLHWSSAGPLTSSFLCSPWVSIHSTILAQSIFF